MQEALTLFDSICNSRWFVKTSIILFLNKIDLFAEKLPHSPLCDYFPDYTGGSNYDAACDYLLHRFVSLNQSAASKQIYAHYTCATDTQQIKCMFLIAAHFLHCPDRLCRFSCAECYPGHPATNSLARMWPVVTPAASSFIFRSVCHPPSTSVVRPLSWQSFWISHFSLVFFSLFFAESVISTLHYMVLLALHIALHTVQTIMRNHRTLCAMHASYPLATHISLLSSSPLLTVYIKSDAEGEVP
jgi:hypothetical protein